MKYTTIKSALWMLSRLVLLWYLYPPAVTAQVRDATLEMNQPNEPVTLLWGIADTMAYVGKLFNYTLPSDAFQGNIVHYNITEVGKDTLPSWLIFNALKAELRGIPRPEDKGHIYLEVKITGDDNSKISDVFSIVVIDDTDNPYTFEQISMETSPKMVRCRRAEPQTLVTVVVDCDLDLMKPNEKLNLIENMVSHLNLAPEMIKLMPVGNKPMIDGSALVVGPGNIKVPNFVGAFISWLAGCGQVTNEHMAILQQVESSAATGDMSSALGYNIVGWHVTNTRFQPKPRKRRNATPTPTLMPPAPTTVIPVTSTVSLSSAFIEPSKTVVMQTTMLVETKTKVAVPSSIVLTGKVTDVITPSETVRMTKTTIPEATEILSTKIITMKSDVMTTSSVTPFTIPATASATVATTTRSSTTASPTPPVPTLASTTMATISTQAPTTSKLPIIKPTAEVIYPDPCLDKSQVIKLVLAITINVGEIKQHKIAEDTFADCYNTNTSDMTIEITHGNGTDLLSSFWLQLTKATNYYINANPLNSDVGSYTFIVNRLVDDLKKVTMGTIAVHVVKLEDTSDPPNHELSMMIETDYDKFMSELMKRLELANKVSQIFHDKSLKALSVTRLERGSVIYAWTNNSLVRGICPVEDIKELVDKMFTLNGDLSPDAIMTMHPYTVKYAASVPLGSCIGHPDFPTRSTMKSPTTAKPTTAKPETVKSVTAAPTTKYLDKATSSRSPTTFKYVVTDTNVTVESAEITTKSQVAAAGAGVGAGSDMWITTVVPAIVIVCMLVIAGIIACCLYRKKRKGNMKLTGESNFSNNKGVPVIFADEYEEKNDSTRPLIMEDEQPPMPPPDYQQASSETSDDSNSTLLADDRNIEKIEMEETQTSPLYSPPPPVTTSNNGKPPHVQSSRGPPPYVPP